MAADNGVPDLPETISFLATLPDIQSAIKVAGSKNGMRVQLEIPESEMGQAVHLLRWRGEVIEVTARVSPSVNNGSSKAKRESARSPIDMAGG